jgi:hypothetical protein
MKSSIFGVLGSGFGLYGYVPALVELGHSVVLPKKYEEKVLSRPELEAYVDQITFAATENEIVNHVDHLVFAKTPTLQIEFLRSFDGFQGKLFLEKPLAKSIREHSEILGFLNKKKIDFYIAYLFSTTFWFEAVKASLSDEQFKEEIFIEWAILRPNIPWKDDPISGGGLIQFYAIHFAKVFSDLALKIISSRITNSGDCLNFSAKSNNGATITVSLRYSLQPNFQVVERRNIGNQSTLRDLYTSATPFGTVPTQGLRDPRVEHLKTYVKNCFENDSQIGNSLNLELEVINFLQNLNNSPHSRNKTN